MLSSSESENFYTLESLMEKTKKEKDKRTVKVLDPYIEKIINLTNDIKKKENLLLYYNLKINKIKDEYDELTKDLIDEENILIETFITAIEKEEFYQSPANLELKDLAERAREKKSKYSKIKDDYDYDKLYMDKREQELQDRIDGLSNEEHNLYLILKEHILNDKDMNKIKGDLEMLSDDNNNNFNEIIKNNKPFLREAKSKMKDRKNELNNIRNEIKNINDKKARKSMNHLNFNNNMSIIKTHSDNNSNNNSMLDNSNNNSFLFNSDLNKTNSDINNPITNLNKTYYLRTNKPFYNSKNILMNRNNYGNNTINNGSNNNFKIKSYSNFLNTDSSDKCSINHKNGKRNVCICKKLLKNYCNKYSDKNSDFMVDLKMKDKKKNPSVPKSLYEQRRIIREGIDDYIYINGNRYKQSLIGKATNTVNGVY